MLTQIQINLYLITDIEIYKNAKIILRKTKNKDLVITYKIFIYPILIKIQNQDANNIL